MNTVTNGSTPSFFSTIFSTVVSIFRKRRLERRAALLGMSLLLGIGLLATPIRAQHEVTGVVTDAETGQTLPGVNIVVQGTQSGSTTRADGSYTIEAESEELTLVFSFVGYQEREVPIEGRSEIDVQLQPAVTAMEEVVVNVGYEEQNVETTTGSVSQVSGEDLDIQPTTNLTQSLQGSVPGLIGVTSSGRPGRDNSTLRIRGSSTLNNNDVLVVIDGVPSRQGGLARINPSDIQNVSVLKDASAAIYGSRAANGVILVQTKDGRSGDTRVNINVERGWAQPTVVPEMADAPTYMRMLNEVQSEDPPFSEEDIQNSQGDVSDSYQYHNTDWYEVGLKDFSRELTASASVTGGGETVQYRVSLNGATENGILVNSGTGFDQLGVRSNVSGEVSDNFSLDLNVHGRREKRSIPAWNRGINAAWEMLQRGKPTQPAFWPNGQPGPAQEEGVNPVVANKTGYDDEVTYFFQGDLNMTFNVPGVDGWNVEGTVAYDRSFYKEKRWQEPWTLYSCSDPCEGEDDLQGSALGVPEPRLTKNDRDVQDIMLRATTSYDRTFGDHNGTLLLGTEWQSSEMDSTHAFRRFFPTDQIQQLAAGGTDQQEIFGTGSHAARLNFFGRANYNYQETYLLEFVARYDGSYIFPEGNRFGFFPSVSAGWRLVQEDWFNSFTGNVFDRMKLRASYGQTGNDQVEPYQYLRTFGLSGKTAFGDGLGTVISQTRVPNEDITWEVATQFDVGLEGAVLSNQLSFNLTYFNQTRDNILWFRGESVPETSGLTLPRENFAEVQTSGYEAEANYTQDVNSDLSFRVGANVSYTSSEIIDFAEPEGLPEYQQSEGRSIPDNPLNPTLYYVADGIWSTQEEIDQADSHFEGAQPGDVRYKDLNGDGNINAEDRRRVDENSRPDLFGGLNLGATYSQFSLNLQFQGAAQVKQYVFTDATGTFGNYYQKFAENRWTPDNTDASGPRAYQRTDPYWAELQSGNPNTYFLRDAKYLRLKAAQLSYTLPGGLTETAGMSRVQFYLSGRNLFTLTPLEIVDPEVRQSAGHVYPPETSYTVGLKMGF